jgi:hypothetical protein
MSGDTPEEERVNLRLFLIKVRNIDIQGLKKEIYHVKEFFE